MKADLFYRSAAGRTCLCLLRRCGLLKLTAWLLHTPLSKPLILPYIQQFQIDMTGFAGMDFPSFAAFFARKRAHIPCTADEQALISPCDGLMSIYPVTAEREFPVKGIVYRIGDLLPEAEAEQFRNGLCFIFRLEASDYHHFCSIDKLCHSAVHYIPGELHSVQPIALRSVPVFRQNRRWWSLLDTAHFGTVAQIAVGAVLVGGVTYAEGEDFAKGEEMGNFELAGSTIILLLEPDVRERLRLDAAVLPAWNGTEEVRVKMGEHIGNVSVCASKY